MKYLKQFGIILALSFIGEFLNDFLPLPIPASIYGIILMFLCLKTKIIPLSAVEETARFLIEAMPLMFIPAAVGLLESWNIIKGVWIQYISITAISTVIVMIVAGHVTQAVINHAPKIVSDKISNQDTVSALKESVHTVMDMNPGEGGVTQ